MARTFRILMASIFFGLCLQPSSSMGGVEFEDNPIGFTGIALGCAAIGAPTCIALWRRDEQTDFSRDSKSWGAEVSFLPSYVLDFAESKAFQRIEASAFSGNVLVALSHRRGVQEPNSFSSTSYRIAYSFDWRHLRPAFGIGARRNVNARNGDCFEIWLPLFANRGMMGSDSFSVFFETVWVIGPVGVRPEIQARAEFQVASNVLLAAGLGYFADYDNAEAELSIGPTLYF